MADISETLTDWSETAASNSPGGTTTIGTGLDDNLRAQQAAIRKEYNKTVPALNPGGRLTLSTGVAVTVTDVTAAETLYYTPYVSDKIVVFDGTNWKQYTFTERSIDIPDATGVYDVFIYDNAGTLTLELTAWTNDTTRATALTTQNGVLVKTGALTRRYLGTAYFTTAGNGQCEDSLANRYLWNYYNRRARPLRRLEATATWTYTTATWRQANAAAANQLCTVIGVAEDLLSIDVRGVAANASAATAYNGIGVGSTSANSATITQGHELGTGAVVPVSASYNAIPAVGRQYYAWLEYSSAVGTTSFAGAYLENDLGMFGTVWG